MRDNNKCLSRLIFLLAILSFVVWVGCGGGGGGGSSSAGTTNTPESENNAGILSTTEIEVSINLPGLSPDTLKTVAIDEAPVDSAGLSTIEVPKDFYNFNFVYAIDENDSIVGMYYGPSEQGKITVDIDSTAKAVVMTIPLDWSEYDVLIADVLAIIADSQWYHTLRQQIESIIDTDPANIISEQHPEIWETAVQIIQDIIQKVSAQSVKPIGWATASSLDILSPAYIEDTEGPLVLIKNPRSVPYGISTINLDTGDYSKYYGIFKTPYWVPGKKWIDHLFSLFGGGDSSVEYTLASGNYTTCLATSPLSDEIADMIDTLGGDSGSATLNDLSAYLTSQELNNLEIIKKDAQFKGTVAWTLEGTLIAVGFIPYIGSAVSLEGEIFLELANTTDLSVLMITKDVFTAPSVYDKLSDGLKFVANSGAESNSYARTIAKLLYGDARRIAGITHSASKLSSVLKILKNVAEIGSIANALFFISDTIAAENIACYDIYQDDSGNAMIQPHDYYSNPSDTTPPSVPTGLTATAISSSQIDLSWNASTDDVGVAGYKIYDYYGTYLKSVTTISASIIGLNPNTYYCFTDSAYDAAGNESGQSSQACAITHSAPSVILVFSSYRDNNWEIYRMNSNGSNQINLTNDSAFDADPAYSSDGSKIIFASNRECSYPGLYKLYTMNSDGTNVTRLPSGFSIAPDGSLFCEPFVLNTPKFSPDGTKIVFRGNIVPGGPSLGNTQIYIMNSDGTNIINLSNNSYNEKDPVFTTDGQKIVFSSNRDGNYQIYIMNIDGSNQTRLTTSSGDNDVPEVSPDGSKITFTSYRDGNYEVYKMNIDGSGQTNLSNNPADDGDSAFSSDGSQIAFISGRNGNYEVYIMNSDGTSPIRLTNTSAMELQPFFKPGGTNPGSGGISEIIPR